jgi:hypothetical protein
VNRWLPVLLLALVTYRITRLVVRDDFPPIRWARGRVQTLGSEALADLVTCAWCASFWVAGAVVLGVEAFLANLPAHPLLIWGGLWAVAPWPILLEDALGGDTTAPDR